MYWMNMNIASKSPRRWHQGPGLPPAQSLGRLNSRWNHWRSEMFTEIFLSWTFVILFFWDHVPMFTDCVHWRFLISCVPLLAVGCHGPQAFLRPSWWLGTIRWDHRQPNQEAKLFFVARATKISGDLSWIGRFFETKKKNQQKIV